MNDQSRLFLWQCACGAGRAGKLWEETLAASTSPLEPGLGLRRWQVARRLVLGGFGGGLEGLEDDGVWVDRPLGLAREPVSPTGFPLEGDVAKGSYSEQVPVLGAERRHADLGVDVEETLEAAGGPDGALDAELVRLDVVVVEGALDGEGRANLCWCQLCASQVQEDEGGLPAWSHPRSSRWPCRYRCRPWRCWRSRGSRP